MREERKLQESQIINLQTVVNEAIYNGNSI